MESLLEKRVGFLEAVVFSGGEGTLQPDLVEVVALARRFGFKTKLDTNGNRLEIVSDLLEQGLLDYIAVDVKALSDRYKELVGSNGDAAQVKETVAYPAAYQKCNHAFGYEVRTPLCPTLTMDDLVRMAGEYSPIRRWYMQQYRKPREYRAEDEKRINLPALTLGEVERNLDALKKYQPELVIR